MSFNLVEGIQIGIYDKVEFRLFSVSYKELLLIDDFRFWVLLCIAGNWIL